MPVTQEIIETARKSCSIIRNLINQIRTLRIRINKLEQQLEESENRRAEEQEQTKQLRQQLDEAKRKIRQLNYLNDERCSGINQTTGMRCKNFGKHQGYCYHHRRY